MPAELSEKSIFLDALGKSTPAERDAFVAEACAGDESLRNAVEALLNAHHKDDHLLDQPVGKLPGINYATTLGDARESLEEGDAVYIDSYRLREQIGEGGFGLVYVAEQQEPVRRKVALKIIKPGMDDRNVIARFEAERQALAMMDHPNIAHVLGAGATKSGRPYFVMELVRGIPITDFCDKHHLDTDARLNLFMSVCRAVQHAHQKGVIHRDLKPSNVLVTMHDATPVAKVIDFGVSKAIGQNLTDKTIYTHFTAMVGTPLYMSPEQAGMSGLDIDTRSDIYSLGVLLYELVTGTTPLDRERIESVEFDELRRIIREEEPPRPSTRLTTMGQRISTISAQRHVDPGKLKGLVRGDLDWIVMKAIEKDRNRRYPTANALAEDVERFVRGEPIEARPPSSWYRFSKFAKRHKLAIISASLVATALIVGAGVSLWMATVAIGERNEKQIALQDAVDARVEADRARAKVEQFVDRLKESSELTANGRIHANEEQWSQAHADFNRATELLPEYHAVWSDRGGFYVRLKLWEQAAADYAKALKLDASAGEATWWGVPQLFWYMGDEARYEQICKYALSSNRNADGKLSLQMIRACLTSSNPPADVEMLVAEAEAFVKNAPPSRRSPDGKPNTDQDRDRPPPPRPPGNSGPPRIVGSLVIIGRGGSNAPLGAILYTAGCANFRAGNYERAIELLKRSETDDPNWPGSGIAYPVIAMAHHRAGNGEEAKAAILKADQIYDEWVGQISQRPVDYLPVPWFDWIEFVSLYREAKILITGFAPVDDPRLTRANERSLQAITITDAAAEK